MQTRAPLKFSNVTITGDRVQLVPITEQYADEIFAEFTDEITRLMIPATPTHIDQVHDFIRVSVDSMRENTDLTFAILKKDTVEFLGICALHGKSSPNIPVLGIWLKKPAHGNRFGQEAIRFLTEWARLNLVYDYFEYPCDRDNIPSRKIAEKLRGTVFRTSEVKSMSGRTLNEVAYRIV